MSNLEKEDNSLSIDTRVKVDKLKVLYQHSFPAVLVSMVGAIIMVSMLWSAQDHSVLYIWLSLMFLCTIFRIILFISYRRIAPQGIDVLAWEKPYFLTLILSSMVWGIGCLFIMPADSKIHQVIIYCTLIGFSGGAFSYYSAHRTMTLATIAIIMLPATFWFMFNGDILMLQVSIFALIFFGSAVRATRGFSETLHQNFLLTHELKSSKNNAEKLALTDELTGLSNRRAFFEYGNILLNSSQRNKSALAIILMDIDHFKSINDTYGHAAGDETLRVIGDLLKQRLRKSDVFARIGGEEFGLLLASSTIDDAAFLSEQLRKSIESNLIKIGNAEFNVTASFGVSGEGDDIETLLKNADDAMYQAKEAGRNRVVCI